MQNVAAEIEEKYSGVKTKIIEVDFAKEDSTSYIPKIEESIKAQWPIFKKFCPRPVPLEGLKIRGFTWSFNGFFSIIFVNDFFFVCCYFCQKLVSQPL